MWIFSLAFHKWAAGLIAVVGLISVLILPGNQTQILHAYRGFPHMVWHCHTGTAAMIPVPFHSHQQHLLNLAVTSLTSQTQQPLDAQSIATRSWHTVYASYCAPSSTLQHYTYTHMAHATAHTHTVLPHSQTQYTATTTHKQEDALTVPQWQKQSHCFCHSFWCCLHLYVWSPRSFIQVFTITSLHHLLFMPFGSHCIYYTASSLMDRRPELL